MRYIALSLLFFALACNAQQSATKPTHITINATSGLVIPAFNNVQTNWQNAGLIPLGGIPLRVTQCGATVSPTGVTPPTGADDSVAINNAITACTAGQF